MLLTYIERMYEQSDDMVLIKKFHWQFFCLWVAFFHGKMNLVGVRVETMALTEAFAWFIHFRFSPENLGIRLWFGLGMVVFWFFKYSVLVFAWKIKSRSPAFLGSSQKHKLFLHKERQLLCPTFRRKIRRYNVHISYGGYQHILSTSTNLML